MKKHAKALSALCLCLTLCLALTGCDVLNTKLGDLVDDFDANGYVQGQLDQIYHGVFAPEYLEMVLSNEEEAQEAYEAGIASEVTAFNNYYSVEYPTEEHTERMIELYKQVYKNADYTVLPANKQEDGSYDVKVTVRPLDIIQRVNERFPTEYETFDADYDDVDVDAMTGEEFNDWFQNTYDLNYQNWLADLFESCIADMGYLEEQSIVLQVELEEESGYYNINENDFKNLDLLIIDYNSEGAAEAE